GGGLWVGGGWAGVGWGGRGGGGGGGRSTETAMGGAAVSATAPTRRAGATETRPAGAAAICRRASTRKIIRTRAARTPTAIAARRGMAGITGTITEALGATTAPEPRRARG